LDSEEIRRLLAAPNAEAVRTHGGKLVAIRLRSFGDDRGHTGERHGTSIITTQRVANDSGIYVGSHLNLKHKSENVNQLATGLGAAQGSARSPIRASLAAK